MSGIVLKPAPLGSALLDEVWKLYRKNSSTLGFLPRGALDELAHAGCVLAATRGEETLGYAAWRRSRGEVVLVHLCVGKPHRGTKCAKVLLEGMIDECQDAAAIRLHCRKDYEAANRLWQRHGFAFVGEELGRGADAAPLFVWRRDNIKPPLLRLIEARTPRATHVVAIDANIFFDLMDAGSTHHEESLALLADWLDDVDVCVTRELRTEVSRQSDDTKRQSAFATLHRFRELAGHPDALEQALAAIGNVLPSPVTDSDYSDRRQLAHAWLEKADFFATRDTTLLDHGDDLRTVTSLRVLRPTDVVARLQGDSLGTAYAPVRLHGTQVERRFCELESDLYPFQRFGAGESKSDWKQAIRAARAAPEQCTVELIGVRGESPRVAIAVDRSSPDTLDIRFLRALSSPLTATLLQRVLANVLSSARELGRKRLTIEDPGPGPIREALTQVGFEACGDGPLVRYTLSGCVTAEDAGAWVREQVPTASVEALEPAAGLEARFWPLKVLGTEILTVVVPIRRLWAARLFDSVLAGEELFGVPEGPALALENVYYSASKIHIPEGSRILWYVSGRIGQVRAVSVCLGTDIDTATLLSRRYYRLGVFGWGDVLSAAKGDAHRQLRAYRFARTEILKHPVSWQRLEALIHEQMKTRNRIASPVRVPEGLFAAVYQEGMGSFL